MVEFGRLGDPVSKEVQFRLAAYQPLGLEERVGVGDVRLGRSGDVGDVTKAAGLFEVVRSYGTRNFFFTSANVLTTSPRSSSGDLKKLTVWSDISFFLSWSSFSAPSPFSTSLAFTG